MLLFPIPLIHKRSFSKVKRVIQKYFGIYAMFRHFKTTTYVCPLDIVWQRSVPYIQVLSMNTDLGKIENRYHIQSSQQMRSTGLGSQCHTLYHLNCLAVGMWSICVKWSCGKDMQRGNILNSTRSMSYSPPHPSPNQLLIKGSRIHLAEFHILPAT